MPPTEQPVVCGHHCDLGGDAAGRFAGRTRRAGVRRRPLGVTNVECAGGSAEPGWHGAHDQAPCRFWGLDAVQREPGRPLWRSGRWCAAVRMVLRCPSDARPRRPGSPPGPPSRPPGGRPLRTRTARVATRLGGHRRCPRTRCELAEPSPSSALTANREQRRCCPAVAPTRASVLTLSSPRRELLAGLGLQRRQGFVGAAVGLLRSPGRRSGPSSGRRS